MPIVFYCPECGQKLRIGDEFAGKPAACVRCNLRLTVPERSEAKSRFEKPPESERFEPSVTEPPREQSGRTAPPPARIPTESSRLEPRAAEFEEPEAGQIEVPEPPHEEPAFVEQRAPASERVERTALLSEREAPLARRPAEPAKRVPAGAARKKGGHVPLMKPPQKIDFEDLIDMTSMVDVVFFLLIFFLVTSMKQIDSSIPMPAPDQKKASSGQPKNLQDIDADEGQIVVRIDKNDTITVEGAEVRKEADLMLKLRDLRLGAGRPDKLLVIGHGDASHGTAVMVLDAGRDVGIEQVRLAVADESE